MTTAQIIHTVRPSQPAHTTQDNQLAQVTTIITPDGPFTIIARESNVLASGWTDDISELTGQIHQSLLPARYTTVASLGEISDAVDAYYASDFEAIQKISVLQISGPFQSHAWEVLRTVAPGKPLSYRQYATLAGNPKAARAVASACAYNAAALFIPCHRIIRSDGTIGMFRWGAAIKESLLTREAEGSKGMNKSPVQALRI